MRRAWLDCRVEWVERHPQGLVERKGREGVSDQATLFDKGEWWEDEWQDMPEFVHEDLQPWKQIIVSFASRADMEAFAKLIGRKVTIETKSIWYPEAEIGTYADKRYAADQPVGDLREVVAVLDSGEPGDGLQVDDGALF
jgi:hypothetical protein